MGTLFLGLTLMWAFVITSGLYMGGRASEQSGMRKKWVAAAAASLALAAWLSGQVVCAAPVQTRYAIEAWDSDQGLPQSSVFAILRGRDGYLWLGTLNGLVRFDGIRFTVFDESNTQLTSSRILYLFEDSKRRLWVGTESAGVLLVEDGHVVETGVGRGSRESRLSSACEDASGRVWLYTADGHIWRYEQGQFTPFSVSGDQASNFRMVASAGDLVWVASDWRLWLVDPANASSGNLRVKGEWSPGRIDGLTPREKGGIWLMANGRIQQWSNKGIELDSGPYPWRGANPPRIEPRISAACEDLAGNLLIGTLGQGIYWLETNGQATCLSTNQGLSYTYILSLCMDREGNLWVGTDGGGLNRVLAWRQPFELLDASRGWVVQSVCPDAEGGLWVGCNGTGVAYCKDAAVQRFGPDKGLFNSYVRSVFVDQQKRVWAGTWGAGLFQLQEGYFQWVAGPEAIHGVVTSICQDRQGRLWVGTRNGLACLEDQEWRVYGTNDGLSGEFVRAITEDPGGGLWVATSGGLDRMRDRRISKATVGVTEPALREITALCMDREGVLWVATASRGLFRLQGEGWTRYTKKEGLISNSLGYVLEDGGFLWIGSPAGLMRVAKRDLNELARGVGGLILCRTFGQADGLPTRECTAGSQPGAAHGPGGRLWFPTIKGLASVLPEQLSGESPPPAVLIESVLVDGQLQNTNTLRTREPRQIVVPPGKERLEIQYTGLNLAAPGRARFKYWLENFESTWTEAATARSARYSKLPPGEYRFHVTARNEDGAWNDAGQTVAIIVQTPFWRTWWFLSGSVILLLGGIVAVVHYASTQKLQRQLVLLEQQRALENERARIARDIHDQLGASLTQVSLLGELVEADKEEPAEIEGHARQITRTARETTRVLDEIVWAVNPSNDTLDGLITYVCKYAQEYLAVAEVRYRLDVPEKLPGNPLPPDLRHNVFLAAKEAITNVVRHAKASSVWLRLRLVPGSFTIEIEDDGRGPADTESESAKTRNGLRNMRKRMEDVGGRFELGPGPQRGTIVRLSAPLGKA